METLDTVEVGDYEMKDKLLQLIEDGDAASILDTEYTESLNDLIKAEYVSIVDERLLLTEKGRQAKIVGIEFFMEQEVPEGTQEIKITDFPQQAINSGISNQSFIIILLFFLISLVVILILTML